jgi:fatty-acyl-CoA synthase
MDIVHPVTGSAGRGGASSSPVMIADLLDRRAAEAGDRLAIVMPETQVTYAQLASRAEDFAAGFIAAGLMTGDTVGILLPNGVDALAALFGAAKIGVVPVPINSRFKEYELAQVVRNARMRLLVTTTADSGATDFLALLHSVYPTLAEQDPARLLLPEAPDLEQIVVLEGSAPPGFRSASSFEAGARSIDRSTIEKRQQRVRGDDMAVLIYTSGTAAAPKGAMISHRALIGFAAGTCDTRLFVSPEDRVWTPLPMFHIGGIAFAIACVYAGCMYCHTGYFRPDVALDQLESLRCTIALPGFETIWLPILNSPDFTRRDLSALRIVMVVGVVEQLQDMASRVPHAVQISAIGMTEASSFLTLGRFDDPLERRINTGGHPLPGMECRVVDPDTGVDVPIGTQGELLFRGTNCFHGYFEDAELTARSFDADGWFHTKDVATMDGDGRLTFVSRLKDMLKVGGENVSAAEVEGYLTRHPAVHIAQVVSAPDAFYVEVPAAFIELKPGTQATEQEIIDFCIGNIATFRVPRYVRFVTEWPMSGTKIKKFVLRERIADELHQLGITQAPKIIAHSGLKPGSDTSNVAPTPNPTPIA